MYFSDAQIVQVTQKMDRMDVDPSPLEYYKMDARPRGMGRSNTVHRQRLKGRKEMFYLTTHPTHFIYGYMASGIW